MAHRYGDTLHHKHDKRHLIYRLHWPSHPCKTMRNQEHLGAIKSPTDVLSAPVKEKMWKRLAKTPFH
ncbi:MAG: hypothetical protein QNK11_09465 [Legionella sp.]|nr:hypothetical protein [Legionella sp.]